MIIVKTMAATVPYITLLLINVLHTAKKTAIIVVAVINLIDTTMSFIRHNTTTQTTSDTMYPNNVAIDAPSIPRTGINTRLIIMFITAPDRRINTLGHVFFATKN